MPKRIDPAARERTVRWVREHRAEYSLADRGSAVIAKQQRVSKETVRRWAVQAEVDHGERPGVTSEENILRSGSCRPKSVGWRRTTRSCIEGCVFSVAAMRAAVPLGDLLLRGTPSPYDWRASTRIYGCRREVRVPAG
jgi:transposase